MQIKREKSFSAGIYFLYLEALFPTLLGITSYVKQFFPADPIHHIAYTNLFNTGISAFLVLYFALSKTKAKWAWFFIFFSTNWAATNDLVAMIEVRNQGVDVFPFPIIPLTLGNIGLLLTAFEVFKKGTK
jgi:hypothetical protein